MAIIDGRYEHFSCDDMAEANHDEWLEHMEDLLYEDIANSNG